MNVLSAERVQAAFSRLRLPFVFTAEELFCYSTTTLVDMPGRILSFPIPENNAGLNILNLRQLIGVDPEHAPSFFDHPWYLNEPFGRADCTPGWHLIHMDPLPDSISQPHDYYRSLKPQGLELPAAIEVVLMLFLHYLETGERLLLKKHTWCSDQAALGRFVTVGAFGRNGVFISGHPENFASRGLGICAKIM